MRADFGRYAFDAASGVKTGACAFVGATAVADVAAFAFLLVALQESVNFFTCDIVESCKDVPLHVWCVFLCVDKSRAGENVSVGGNAHGSVIHVARIVSVS